MPGSFVSVSLPSNLSLVLCAKSCVESDINSTCLSPVLKIVIHERLAKTY